MNQTPIGKRRTVRNGRDASDFPSRLTAAQVAGALDVPRWSSPATYAALVIVLAFVLRLSGITWQLPWRLHPDEPPHVEEAVTIAATRDFHIDYVNQPPFFRNVVAVEIMLLDRLGLMGGQLNDADSLADTETDQPNPVLTRAYAIARTTSAVMGALTVVLVFLSVRPLLGMTAAILGALVLAVSLAHVRESHFATTTVPALCMSTLAMYFAAKYVATGGLWKILASMVAVALAIWTRDLMLFSVGYPAAALLARSFRPRDPRWWAMLLAVGACCALGMLLGYIFLLPYQSLEQVQQGSVIFYKIGGGELKAPELWVVGAYAETLAQSLGVPLLICGFAGGILMLVWKPRAALVFGSFFALTLLGLMIHARPWLRFGIPLEVFLSISAGFLIATGIQLTPRLGRWRRLGRAALTIPFILPAINAGYFGLVTGREDTRVAARSWIQSELPPRALVYAPGFTLPNVRADMAAGRPNVIAHVWGSDIPQVITGQGCGEALVLSSLQDWISSSESIDSAEGFAQENGKHLVRFTAGYGGADVELGLDDGFSPFWNLWRWSRPGPTVDLYEMSPPCQQRGPAHKATDLTILSTSSRGTEVSASSDPRVTDSSGHSMFALDSFPERVTAAVLGTFVKNEAARFQAIVFEQYGQQRLAVFRVSSNQPAQLVMLDDEIVTKCGCVANGGLQAVDTDGDGVDELLALRYELGVQYVDTFSLDSSEPRLLRRAVVQDRGGVPAASFGYLASDLIGSARLAFLFEIGSQFWIDVWRMDPTASVYARGPSMLGTYVLPASADDLSPRMATGDFDGDGRNELALIDQDGKGIEIFRLPVLNANGPASLTHYQHRGTASEVRAIFTGKAPIDAVASDQPTEILTIREGGRSIEVSSLVVDRSTPFSAKTSQLEQIGSLGEKDVVGATAGRFLDSRSPPWLAVMLQQGRTVTVELFPGNADGTFSPRGIEVDRWRTEESDQPLSSSLAAVDIDGDGIDELVSGRKTNPLLDEYEFHVHRAQLDPKPSLDYLGRSQNAVPTGATFAGLTRVRHVVGQPDRLAMAYYVGSAVFVDVLEANPGPELKFLRTSLWRVLEGAQIHGFAAGRLENGYARTLFMGLRSPETRALEVAPIDETGATGRSESLPWPDLRNSRALLSTIE